MWVGIVWSAISAVGLGFYASLFRKAQGDVIFLRRHGLNSVRLLYAKMRARLYLGLGSVQLLYLTVGILYTADSHLHVHTDTPRGVAALISRSLLFLGTIILAVIAIYTDRLRDNLVDTIKVVNKEEGS
jgi:hypothetical protein